MRIIIVILEFGFTRPWGQGPWGGFEIEFELSLEFWRFGASKVRNCQQFDVEFELTLEFWRFGTLKVCNCQQFDVEFELSLEFWRSGALKVCNCQQFEVESIWLRLCRPRGKAGVGFWGFLWVFAGSGGPWRWSLGGVLMAFGKRRVPQRLPKNGPKSQM